MIELIKTKKIIKNSGTSALGHCHDGHLNGRMSSLLLHRRCIVGES